MNRHISIFFDETDYEKKLTNDSIINITGSVGSGKSTLGRKYASDGYIVVGLDSIFGDKDPDTRNEHTEAIKTILAEKYGLDFQTNLAVNLVEYYQEILKYIGKNNGLIEGAVLCNETLFGTIKGKVIVKRTAKIKCYYRSVTRDLKNPDWSAGPNYINKLKRIFHVLKRRLRVFNTTKIENFIRALEINQSKIPRNE